MMLVTTVGLAGCAVGPDYQAQVVRPVALAQGSDSALFSSSEVQRDWWRQFQDPQLDKMVDIALERNHDIRIVQARLLEARAVVDQKKLDELPTVTAEASYSRSLSQANPGPVGSRNLAESYRTSMDASWEIDLFGRLRRIAEASAARSEAVEADLAQARIVVVAEVARNYFEMRGAEQRLTVAQANLKNQEEALRVVEVMWASGRGSADDLSRARAEVASTRATIPPLETDHRRAFDRLAVLTGSRPDEMPELTRKESLPPLAARFPIGKLSELLGRRPDVVSAERELAASTADIGAITAELYPRIDLGGFLGFVAVRGVDLGSSPSQGFGVAPVISWPAFHLATVKARQREVRAREKGARARYEQTVLRAIEETDVALTTYEQTQKRVRDLAAAAVESERAAELARARYRAGNALYLVQLDAERNLLNIQDALSEAEMASYVSMVALYKALGGGWVAPEYIGTSSAVKGVNASNSNG